MADPLNDFLFHNKRSSDEKHMLIEPSDAAPIAQTKYIDAVPFHLRSKLSQSGNTTVAYYYSLPITPFVTVFDQYFRDQRDHGPILRGYNSVLNEVIYTKPEVQFAFHAEIYANKERFFIDALQHENQMGTVMLITSSTRILTNLLTLVEQLRESIVIETQAWLQKKAA